MFFFDKTIDRRGCVGYGKNAEDGIFMNQIKISASILASNFMQMGNEVDAVINGGSDWIHVDVMDGVFVPNITLGVPFVEGLKKITSAPLDVHLMIVQPERHIASFIEAGAETVTVHVENNANIHSTLSEIHRLGAKPAVALNPGTPAEMIEPLLPFVDMVLVMTVNPGFGGQKFIPQTLSKIRTIRNWIKDGRFDVDIQVDGGINEETVRLCSEAGANVFVAGTSIFRNPVGYGRAIRSLRNAASLK